MLSLTPDYLSTGMGEGGSRCGLLPTAAPPGTRWGVVISFVTNHSSSDGQTLPGLGFL
jgi:hypothetical protein